MTEIILVGGILAILLEVVKWLSARKGKDFAKIAIIVAALLFSLAYASLSQFAPAESLKQGAAIFATATTMYAALYKPLVKPLIQSLTK
jgi:hypothetical protein